MPNPRRGRETGMSDTATMGRGWTPRELARLLRVRPERVRAWIEAGEMPALNTASTRCGKPRYVVLPHHLAEWERRHRVAIPPSPAPRRRKPATPDYYPD